jgi:uncharacterized protein (TIGR00255 family)
MKNMARERPAGRRGPAGARGDAGRNGIRGMTGFGGGAAEEDGVRFEVEIKGVNNRFLDSRVKLPGEFAALEAELKQKIQARVARGRVDAVVGITAGRAEGVRLEVRRALVEAYLDAARDLKRAHRLKGALGVDQVLGFPGVVQVVPEAGPDPESAGATLRRAFDAALDAFDDMRAAEGGRLVTDLLGRLAEVDAETRLMNEEAARQPALQGERLRGRLAAILGGDQRLDAARLAQEVALLADRVDITEELVRLAGYLEQARGLLETPPGPVGKTLDFVMQEMNREANTISSKSEALPICQAALRVRSIVEAIREQVQNLE